MPKLFLVGGSTHREGTHTIHVPKLDVETGKPQPGITSVTFVDGAADVDDVGAAKWLQEKGHASAILVPAYGLCQPGKGPVLAYGEDGNAIEVTPAEPATLPAVVADRAPTAAAKKES